MTTNANVSLGINAVNNTNTAFRQARANVVSMNSAVGGMNSAVLRNRRVIQQAGMQMSDFAVQVAGGQSVILAFTQQVPQFIQGFGAMGGVLAALITIFGTIALVTVKSGVALSQITPIMGVLEDQFASLVPIVQGVGNAFIWMANLIVNNLDRILILGSVVAAFYAGRWVASFIMAGGATTVLTGAINLLRFAMLRLPFALIAMLIAELIYRFLQLAEKVGGVGKAFALLKDVAVEAFNNIGLAFDLVPLAIAAGSAKMAIVFGDALTRMGAAFAEFTWTVADGLNNLFDLNLNGVAFNPTVNPEWFGTLEQLRSESAAASEAFGAGVNNLMAASPKLQELLAALNSVTDTQYDVRDWFGGVEDAAGGGGGGDGGGAAAAVKKVADAFKELKSSISGSIETMFMDIVKGTSSVTDAFKKMASDIILEMYRVMMVQQWVAGIMDFMGFFTGMSPAPGSTASILGTVDGARASGGPVAAGKTYLVGEQGPELFSPSTGGRIVSNDDMGAAGGSAPVVIHQHFHISTGVAETVRAEIAATMPTFRRMAISAVEDAKRRNQTR